MGLISVRTQEGLPGIVFLFRCYFPSPKIRSCWDEAYRAPQAEVASEKSQKNLRKISEKSQKNLRINRCRPCIPDTTLSRIVMTVYHYYSIQNVLYVPGHSGMPKHASATSARAHVNFFRPKTFIRPKSRRVPPTLSFHGGAKTARGNPCRHGKATTPLRGS